jgi:hypothetical protein
MPKKGSYQIPFDKDGNQMGYAARWHEIEWRDNTPFIDTLTYVGFSRGRSAATLHFERSDGTGVEFFMTDFDAIVLLLRDGKLTGTFAFVKRGQNYGCHMLQEVE